ncbi:MAG: MFS transporter, partial [Dehalococcoidia bacterium]
MSDVRPYSPPAAKVLPQGVFYGWYIALACSLLMLVGVGVGYYGLAVYLKPLQEAHGWSNTAVSAATGLYFSVAGLTSAFIGPRIDRHGPMRFMAVGLVLNAVSAGAIGFVNELWQLYVVYAVLAFGFGISSGVAVNAIMTRWFIRQRAKAMSISSTGVSLGGVVIPPLASVLIDAGGIELAATVLAIAVVVVSVPVLALVIAWDPAQMGLKPDGNLGPAPANPRVSEESQMRYWGRREALGTMAFWSVLIAFLLVLTAQTGFVIHQISFLEERLGSRNEAALALSTTAMGSIIARLIVGLFADAMDKRWLTAGLFVIQGTAVLLVLATENVAATYLLTLTFGFTIGNIYMMQS